jgi:CHASE2 domain-containing sensor protein
MGKLVTLRLDGNLKQQGFQVILEVGLEGERPQVELQGYLPPDVELAKCLQRWQQSYQGLGIPSRIKPQEIVYGGSVNRVENCRQIGHALCDRFQQWLRSESFQMLDLRLREELQKTDLIRIVLRSSDRAIRQLPWSVWDLLKRFPQAELVLSAPTSEQPRVSLQHHARKTVRILAILGHSIGIDVEGDRQRLMALPNAQVTLLVEPDRQQINDRLWEQAWDILFFAGHSQTQEDTGRIYINPHDSFSIAELSYGIQRAIAQGLQLAIFNSCDGLGLVSELESLQLPQMIVMREPVPDRVAQLFLHYFLSAFASDLPLHLAIRQARERLQGIEDEFPYASWLPILCQTPNAHPPTWSHLRGDFKSSLEIHSISLGGLALTGFLVSTLVVGMQSMGLLQSFELNVFDQWMRLRPSEAIDDRILVVTIDEADIQYQDAQGMERRGSLSDQALAQLLQTLSPYHPRVIGLDIFHDFEFSSELAIALKDTSAFIATCAIANTAEDPNTIAAPPGFVGEDLGFSDIPVDPGYVIRRQFLGMSSAMECPTDQSLSLRVALRYLDRYNGSELGRNAQDDVQIGDVVFLKLTPNAGGYQLPIDESKGYQILLNYRQASFQQVSLRSLLKGDIDDLAEKVGDRIVLIGVDGSKDVHLTPYSQGKLSERMPGIVVQAHMVSQVVSSVIDRRPLLRWIPLWAEIAWISLFSVSGRLWAYVLMRGVSWRYIAIFALSLGSVIILTYSLCFILLLKGWWIPFVSPVLAFIVSCGASAVSQPMDRLKGYLTHNR